MNLRCLAVDDEPPALSLVVKYIQQTPDLELVGAYYNPIEAWERVKKEDIDLIFLDINMPDLNGLELSKLIPAQTRVIFTTAYSEFALESYKVSALDYLLKPFSYPDFLQAVEKARDYFGPRNQGSSSVSSEGKDHFFVRSEYKQYKVKVAELLFVENIKDYVRFFFADGHTLMSLMTLTSVEDILSSHNFMKVHRSYIVNLDKVEVVERNHIVFDKQKVPISQAYRAEFQAYLEGE